MVAMGVKVFCVPSSACARQRCDIVRSHARFSRRRMGFTMVSNESINTGKARKNHQTRSTRANSNQNALRKGTRHFFEVVVGLPGVFQSVLLICIWSRREKGCFLESGWIRLWERPFCAERWGKNYNSWMGDETSSAAASMHTFVGSWRLFQFPCGEKLPLRHWPPSAFLVRVDSCVETKALICLALWQWLLGAAIVRSPNQNSFQLL